MKIICGDWLVCKFQSNCTGYEELGGTLPQAPPQAFRGQNIYTPHNYCDSEPIFVVFDALECARSTLQCDLNELKIYVIDVWYARCEATV